MTSGTREGILELLEEIIRETGPWPREVCVQIASNSMFSLLRSAGRTTVRDIPRGLVRRQKISEPVIKWLLYPHQVFTRIM